MYFRRPLQADRKFTNGLDLQKLSQVRNNTDEAMDIDGHSIYDYYSHIGLTMEHNNMKHTHYWPVATAKSQFSALLEQANSQGPQTVTRHGRPAVVVASVRDWEAKAKRSESLTDFLMNSPLRASGLKPRRLRGKWRKTDL